jgi:hypothetical protein
MASHRCRFRDSVPFRDGVLFTDALDSSCENACIVACVFFPARHKLDTELLSEQVYVEVS